VQSENLFAVEVFTVMKIQVTEHLAASIFRVKLFSFAKLPKSRKRMGDIPIFLYLCKWQTATEL